MSGPFHDCRWRLRPFGLPARTLAFLGVLLALSGCASERSPVTDNGDSEGRRRIAVIPKSTSHVFWNSVESGARKAAEELDVEIIWKGPIKESDRRGQVDLVQQLSSSVDGIVLAPLDSKVLANPVRAATQSGVPVVIIDSGLEAEQGTDYVSFVATNNELGGQLGGEKLVELLSGEGKVVLLRYMVGSASTTNRENGFLSALGQASNIELISDNRYAGTTAGEAQTSALNMVDVLKQADGVFCPNESATAGMLEALRKQDLAGKLKFVGFDAAPPLVQALANGEIDALVVQNPFQMGYLGVKSLVAHLDGETVEPLVDTGVSVVTRDNMNDPEIASLLK